MLPGTITFLKGVLEASWQGSLVILLILAVRPLMGLRVPARWRCLLWTFVLIRLLIPAHLLPPSPASFQNIPAIEQPIERAQVSLDNDYAGYLIAGEARNRRAGIVETAAQGNATLAPRQVERPRQMPWWQIAAMIWLSGAALFAAWIAGATIRLYCRLRREDGAVDAAIGAVWESCCARFSSRHPPRLLATGWVASPALVGLMRPALLIPRKAQDVFSAEDWEHIFMHELAHFRRSDHWVQALQLLALCGHWFNPLVWIGFRFLRADRELATDELALRRLAGNRAAAYGRTLLKVLSGRSIVSLQAGMVGIMEDGAQLKQRLRRIVVFGPRRAIGSAVGLALAIVFAAVALGRQMDHADAVGENRVYQVFIPAQRGDILDRNGAVLVTNRLGYNLAISFQNPLLSDAEAVAFARQQIAIAKSLLRRGVPGISDGTILRYYKNLGTLPLDISEDLSAEEQSAVSKRGSRGLVLRPSYFRSYPNGPVACHILGYVGRSTGKLGARTDDNELHPFEFVEGREGLESSFNQVLTGKPGQRVFRFDAQGEKVSDKVLNPPFPGYQVITTLDLNLQKLCENTLKQRATPGAIVIIDTNTGEVLAMASWPQFDPNFFVPAISSDKWKSLNDDPDHPLVDRAFGVAYPPGSAFKVFVGLAALENGTIKLDTKIPNPALLKIGGQVFHDSKNSDLGTLGFPEALEQNADTWFYQVGIKTGGQSIVNYALKYGLSQKTAICLPGESAGAIPTDAYLKERFHTNWNEASKSWSANLSIGQGVVLVTPVQMAQAMAILANGSAVHQTYLVTRVQSRDGKTIFESGPRIDWFPLNREDKLHISPDVLAGVKGAMVTVANNRQGAFMGGAQVAGDKGTGQWLGPKNKPCAASWFAGYAPADRPKYAFAVLSENAEGSDRGDSNTSLMVRNVLHQLLKNSPPSD